MNNPVKQREVHHILVTGGAGFIGSAFIRYMLNQRMDKIVNLDALTYAGNIYNLASVADDPRYIFQQGDIRDEELVETLCRTHEIDTIIHLAAESHVDRSISGPKAFIETNVLGTYHLLEVVRRNPHLHFHHVSTDEVYGCLGETGLFTETTPYNPKSPYSASKACSDHFVRAYANTYGLSTCISNCSNNYGPYQYPEKLIPVILQNCLDRKPLPVYGEGKNVRDWLFVDDHAEALALLLTHGRKGETYNIGGSAERRNIDLVHILILLVAEIENIPQDELHALITFVKDRPGHDFRYAIDCSKIQDELGWTPRHSFQAGMRATVQWYLQNKAWVEACLN